MTRSSLDPWTTLDATAQAELIARGEVAPDALVRAACRRIERIDPALNAVPVRLFDGLAELGLQRPSDRSAAPFAGVPFLMKDVGARQAGQPYYAGNRALRSVDYRAESDTPLGARFREIGLVTIGKSNTPEFGLQSNTWPLVYGPARNPWDPRRSAGGSSGGACAAVAAGLVPVAHASDGAGSIRIPAAWCGLVGFKPSRDRIVWRHAGTGSPEIEFVVARSLRDTAAFVDELAHRSASPPTRGSTGEGEPMRRHRDAVLRGAEPLAPLRVGICLRAPSGAAIDPGCHAAVEQVAARLTERGHRVESAHPSALFEYEDRALHGAVIGPLEYRRCLDDLSSRLGRALEPGDVEPFLWELAAHDALAGPGEVERAAAWTRAWVARVLTWFDTFDVLVTPTVPGPAPLLRDLDPRKLTPLELLGQLIPHMVFTEPWNATGQPAISLPLGRSAEGLPLGVQLIAGPDQDALLLALSADLLDPARGAATPLPPLHA